MRRRQVESDLIGVFPPREVGGCNGIIKKFRAPWRCGKLLTMAQCGHGEVAVMKGTAYNYVTDVVNWNFFPSENMDILEMSAT